MTTRTDKRGRVWVEIHEGLWYHEYLRVSYTIGRRWAWTENVTGGGSGEGYQTAEAAMDAAGARHENHD